MLPISLSMSHDHVTMSQWSLKPALFSFWFLCLCAIDLLTVWIFFLPSVLFHPCFHISFSSTSVCLLESHNQTKLTCLSKSCVLVLFCSLQNTLNQSVVTQRIHLMEKKSMGKRWHFACNRAETDSSVISWLLTEKECLCCSKSWSHLHLTCTQTDRWQGDGHLPDRKKPQLLKISSCLYSEHLA